MFRFLVMKQITYSDEENEGTAACDEVGTNCEDDLANIAYISNEAGSLVVRYVQGV